MVKFKLQPYLKKEDNFYKIESEFITYEQGVKIMAIINAIGEGI